MSEYVQRAEKVLQRIIELASISEDEKCITRTYGTKAFIDGRNKVEQWMREAGLEVWIDNIGNVRGRLPSTANNARTFVIGSHIDTIMNAGKFDGPLGVLIGIDILEGLNQFKPKLPFNIELAAFCDEEGCRFHTTYLGSKVIAGSFEQNLLTTCDEAGTSLADVILKNGGDLSKITMDAIEPGKWLGYFEIHIEQGPVLYEKNLPVGIVTAIAGQRRAELIFTGEAGHAGTVPMNMRKDALAAAAEFIGSVEQSKDAINESQANIVATVGKLIIRNAASNVIPGEVILSLDVRSDDNDKLARTYEYLKTKAEEICNRRGIGLTWKQVQATDAVACDADFQNLLAASMNQSGLELINLVSGAGHDAVPIASVAPVSMLFVRCFRGISHNPLEDVELKDLAAAIEVSDNFIKHLINRHT